MMMNSSLKNRGRYVHSRLKNILLVYTNNLSHYLFKTRMSSFNLNLDLLRDEASNALIEMGRTTAT